MKKKLLSLLLMCGLVLTLAACGGAPAENPASGGNEAASGAAETDANPADTGTPADAAPDDAAQLSGETAADTGSDVEYVKGKGKLVVGITDFAPMDYRNDAGEWVGFDADMAKAFAESLGVEAEFVEINWDNKLMELQTKAIDAVWNGMTITDEVKQGASVSEAYCNNGQVVVVPAEMAAAYSTPESLATLSFAVENGSAGAAQLDALGIPYAALDTQARALMEVASGASDACVIDLLMAGAMIGEGTSYPDLTYTVQLNNEEYGVAFRKGSDLPEAFNAFWADASAKGVVMSAAETYGVQQSVIVK
ncbi:MAG: transporter substrate-binding domain-containing protein [Oscillibacter sp.]|nr:transporter substrate-binding domain-containing protein [Oscillibacter sp.]